MPITMVSILYERKANIFDRNIHMLKPNNCRNNTMLLTHGESLRFECRKKTMKYSTTRVMAPEKEYAMPTPTRPYPVDTAITTKVARRNHFSESAALATTYF